MIHLDLAAVGDVVLHIVVDLVSYFLVVLHILVDALDNVVAGGANGNKGRSRFARSHERTHRGKAGGDSIGRGGIHTAAALPFRNLAKLNAEGCRGVARHAVKLLCLGAQGAAGIITEYHVLIPF